MIRSHSAAAVSGIIVSDVNFNFSCFVHNSGFCFLQVWCPTVFVSSGHHVLLNFGIQDTLSYNVLKQCATLSNKRSVTAQVMVVIKGSVIVRLY